MLHLCEDDTSYTCSDNRAILPRYIRSIYASSSRAASVHLLTEMDKASLTWPAPFLYCTGQGSGLRQTIIQQDNSS